MTTPPNTQQPIKRYEGTYRNDFRDKYPADFYEDPEGDWVKYEDIEHLLRPSTESSDAGIEVAAAYLDKQAEDYINENASTEPDTGATAWHYGQAGNDYYNTLVELAEELRGLKDKSQPAPVSTEKQPTDAEIRAILHNCSRMIQPGQYSDTEFDCLEDVITFVRTCIEESQASAEPVKCLCKTCTASVEAHADAPPQQIFRIINNLARLHSGMKMGAAQGQCMQMIEEAQDQLLRVLQLLTDPPTAPLPDQAAGELTRERIMQIVCENTNKRISLNKEDCEIYEQIARAIEREVRATAPVAAGEPVETEDVQTRQGKLLALADRIDYEKIWRLAGMDHDKLSEEQKDRMLAGVNLRRYAEVLAPGRWIIIHPSASIQFSSSTLDKAVAMAKRDETRRPAPPTESLKGDA